MKRIAIITIIAVSLAAFAGCDKLTPSEMDNRGLAAYKSGNYAEAVKWFRKAAAQGYTNSNLIWALVMKTVKV